MPRAVFVSLFFVALSASATTLDLDPVRANFDALAARSDVAAHVRVLQIESRYEGHRIVTDARCEVLSAGFGADVGQIVTITTLGGVKGNIGQRVWGLSAPAPDEELGVLLGRDGYMGGGHLLIGFSLGMYRVLRDPWEPIENAVVMGAEAIYRGPLRETAPLTVVEFLSRARAAKGLP